MTGEAQQIDPDTLPFVVPCRTLSFGAPLRWLRLGLIDFRRAWPQSLCYGVFMAGAMAAVSWLAWRYGSYWFMLAMVGGFVFIAPLTCTGLYVLSAQLERGPRSVVAGSRALGLPGCTSATSSCSRSCCS